MGKLLSLLARDDSSCCTPKTYDVFLDFENAAPTETEREIYDEVERVLRESDAVLDEIQCYKVCARGASLLESINGMRGSGERVAPVRRKAYTCIRIRPLCCSPVRW